jgi:hypothetical protein
MQRPRPAAGAPFVPPVAFLPPVAEEPPPPPPPHDAATAGGRHLRNPFAPDPAPAAGEPVPAG